MKTWTISAAIVALLILALSASACEQEPCRSATPPVAAGAGAGPVTSQTTPPAPKTYTTDQLVTMTVAQAWDCSGQNYQAFVSMVRDLANLSMQKRGITIPDTNAAGNEIGCMIRQRAQTDPNQLLYAVVDSSIRDYATAHNLPTNAAATCPF